jgi:hypothetical protein
MPIRRWLAGHPWLPLLALLCVPARASARSCIRHAYETMTISLGGVFQGDKAVPRPPALLDLDELINSGDMGRGILLWQKQTMGFAKFYKLRTPAPPTPEAARYIESVSKDKLKTACGYPVSYTPILPGVYPFEQEHSDGARVPRGVEDPVLSISADRKRATLEFSIAKVRYRAEYQVTRAYFSW